MTDGTALLAAILANPDEDTPRLVYADWLQEQGDEARAEFIRVQCEAFRTENEAAAFALDERAAELLEEHDIENGNWIHWLPIPMPLVLWSHPHAGLNMRCEFKRGFVHEVEARAADWLAHGDAIVAAHPVREVRLTTWPEIEYDDGKVGSPNADICLVGRDHWEHIIAAHAYTRTDMVNLLLRAEWPGVTFTLPPDAANWSIPGNPAADIVSAMQQLGITPSAALVQAATGVPPVPPH